MKKYTSYFVAILCLISFSNCSKSFSYRNVDMNKNFDTSITDIVNTNHNSTVFVRTFYIDDPDDSFGKKLINTDEKNKKLIEVQYLIINGDSVLYISTISSKYIYDKSEQYLLRGNIVCYPNTFFFNSFYFGKIIKGSPLTSNKFTIEFRNKKNIFHWNFSKINDPKHEAFNLESIENYKIKNKSPLFESIIIIDRSVKNDVHFKNIYRYHGNPKHYFHYLSFRIPVTTLKEAKVVDSLTENNDKIEEFKNSDFIQNDDFNKKIAEKYSSEFPQAKAIYLVYKDDKKSKVKEILIPFDKPIRDQYNCIKFRCKNVIYSPIYN